MNDRTKQFARFFHNAALGLAQASALVAVMLVVLGMEWLSGNVGLHPLVAGLLAAGCLTIPYIFTKPHVVIDDEEEEDA